MRHSVRWTDPSEHSIGSPARHPRLTTGLCALLVMVAVFAVACVHYHGQTLARGPDQADMLLSFFHEASHAVEEEGVWAAMYTPGVRAGVPNWSNPNYHPLYPLYFNWAGGDATVYATLDRLNWIIYLHLAILGGGGFYLARVLGVRLLPAICVGLVLPFFPAVRSAAAWPHIIAGMAWLPWVFGFQSKLYTGNDRRAAVAAIAGLVVAATALVYAQPAQNLVFAIFGSALIWIGVAAQVLTQRERDARRRFISISGWLALAALVVAMTTGGYLLEVLAFHDQSIRWLGEYGGYLVGDQAVPVGAMRVHSLAADDIGLLAAFEYRKGIGNGYLGAMLAIAALSLLGSRGQSSTRLQVARAMAVCAVVAALFCFSFMAPLVSHIPVANKVREITWWSCLAVVLLVPLAALGLQRLQTGSDAMPRRVADPRSWAFAAGLVLALAATITADTGYRAEAVIVLVAGFAALAWSVLARGLHARANDLACATVLICAVWIPFRHNIEFARAEATLFLPDRVQAHADASRLLSLLPDESSYRIVLGPDLPNAHLLTHAYTALGFRSIHGGIGPANHAKYELLATANPAVSALYGVKYTLLPETTARPGDRKLRSGLILRTDPAALPRLFFVSGGVRVADDPVAELRAVTDASPVYTLVARRDLPEGFDMGAYARDTRGIIAPILSENRRTRLRGTLDSDSAGVLILNEDPEARWTAHIDGKPVAAFRINGFQTAFAIPNAGRHVIEIERPGPLFGRAP